MSSPIEKVNRASLRVAVIAASLAALLAVSGGVAMAVSGEPDAVDPGGPVPPTSQAPPSTPSEAGLADSVALLRRAPSASDAIPASLPVSFSQASGANPELARRVAGDQGAEAWVVPGSGSTCILAQVQRYRIGGAVCTTTAGARAGELNVQSASSLLPGAELVAGLAPDGVSSVTMQLADGTTLDATVHENVYLALIHGAVTAMSAPTPLGAIAIPAMSASSASPRFATRG
jgi:hypothetical protein